MIFWRLQGAQLKGLGLKLTDFPAFLNCFRRDWGSFCAGVLDGHLLFYGFGKWAKTCMAVGNDTLLLAYYFFYKKQGRASDDFYLNLSVSFLCDAIRVMFLLNIIIGAWCFYARLM